MQESFATLSSKIRFEELFCDLEASAKRLQVIAKALTAAARKLAAASETGETKALLRSYQSVTRGVAEVKETGEALALIEIDKLVSDFSAPHFLSEILEAASRLGLSGLRVSRSSLLSYPHRVEFTTSAGYRLGRRTITAMRPTVIARTLQDERNKTVAAPATLLETLHKAYVLLTNGNFGISVLLSEVYDLLTLLPEAKKAYSEDEFIRDVGMLDEHGPRSTRDGARISFPAATSARLNRGYTSVNSKGDEVLYASIRFDHDGSD